MFMVNWKMVAEGGCLSTCAPGAGRGFWLEFVVAKPESGFAAAVDCVAAVVFSPVLYYPHPRTCVRPFLRH